MSFDYTDNEIREELARLGYNGLTENQLQVFKKQLMRLVISERNKRNFRRLFGDIPIVGGNNRTYGKQTPHHDYKTGRSSSNVSDTSDVSCIIPMTDFGRKTLMGDMHVGNNKYPDVRSYQRELTLINSPDLSRANSESSLRSKVVKWSIPREGSFDFAVGGDAYRRSLGSIEGGSGLFEKRETNSRLNFSNRRGDGDENVIPSSSQPQKETKVVRNISGIILHKEHPHTRNLYRTKPFERHQMYLRAWKTQPPIGEASRDSVIWGIHKRLIKKEEVKWPQKTLTPNPYVVPTTKPRYELRWAIRQCNENYEMPPCGFFHENTARAR